MYRQPSRFERRLSSIEYSSQKGDFSVKLYLYSSERKRLRNLGFVTELVNSDDLTPSALTLVTWDGLSCFFTGKEDPIYLYCIGESTVLPKVYCFADECFLRAWQINMSFLNKRFANAILDVLESCSPFSL